MIRLDDKAYLDAARLISGWRRTVLMTHAKPDGDAIGSLLAMRELLKSQANEATPLLFEPLPARYAFLPDAKNFAAGDANSASAILAQADSIMVVDTCSYSQLEPVANWLKQTLLPKLIIDHHSTRDALTPNLLVDETAAATCLIIYELAQACGWPSSPSIASSLFVGLSTDTGWFRHSNTDARALHAAADLVSAGVKPYELFEALYQQDSASRIRLLAEALKTIELNCGDRAAIMTLSRDAFIRTKATPAETEDIVNEPLRIASVVVSVLLVEQDDGQIRINFRSKAPDPLGVRSNIDVAAIAKEFGGGGHRHAAGARSKEPLNIVRENVLARLATALIS
jgi:bifunctional oligoribonuclease and PAP phosphatase NrnA